jgi:hypothetical protein
MARSVAASRKLQQWSDLGVRRGNSDIGYSSPAAPRTESVVDAAAGTSPSGPISPGGPYRAPLGWAITVFLLLQFVSVTFLFPDQGAGDLVRVAGLLVLSPFVWPSRTRTPPIDADVHCVQAREFSVFQRFLIGYGLWALSSTLLHGAVGQFLTHIGGTIMLLIVVRVLTSDGGAAIARVAPLIFGSVLALSAGTGFLFPSVGIAGGRLRGVFNNANLLAFYSLLALVAGVLLVRRGLVSLTLSALSVVLIYWTGSRATAIAAVCLVVLLALFGSRRARWIVGALVCVVLSALVGIIETSGSLIVRAWGSRDASVGEAMRAWSIDPLLGLGFGGPIVEVASTPLRALAEGGLVALAGVVIMYVVLLREAFRRNAVLSALCIAAVIHSFGEAWLLSSIGPMMLVFTATWIAVSFRYGRGSGTVFVRCPEEDSGPEMRPGRRIGLDGGRPRMHATELPARGAVQHGKGDKLWTLS